MAQVPLSQDLKQSLLDYLEKDKNQDLINVYLFYVEKAFGLKPVLFPRDKMIYQNPDAAVKTLEDEGQLYHEAEIKISFNPQSVNEETQKIYICPFTGKVFGDNTHPNPQDAIYDWVSRCPENKERMGGVRVKRFFVSEDPDVIKSYIPKEKPREGITRKVFSSLLNGKIFGSKQAVIDDFTKNYLRPMTMVEVQNQNRFKIEDHFLKFLQGQIQEEKIAGFVESISGHEEFHPYLTRWFGEAV